MDEKPSLGARALILIAGALVGNAAMGLLYLGLFALFAVIPRSNTVFAAVERIIPIPSMLLVPIAGGLVAAWVWQKLELGMLDCVIHSLWMCLVGIGAAYLLLHEGVICIIMVSPLLWGCMLVGVLIGRSSFGQDKSRLNLCIFPLVIVLAWAEMETRTYPWEVETDQILIHAPPSKVWPHVLAFPPIQEKPTYWVFRAGLPYPMATTNGGNFVGAPRHCIFSGGVTVNERVAELIPDQRLTFDVTEQIRDPEAYGHLTLHRGQFQLQDNHDGTTTLIGSTWYTLHVTPELYFNWWMRDMTRAVHLRVMKHIRELSETPNVIST